MPSLPRAEPHEVGVPPLAIHALLDAFEREGHELHSLMIVRDGRVAVEGWWHPYRPQEPHLLYSLSKSFTSTAVGFALAEERFRVDDRVIDLFHDAVPGRIDPKLRKLTVRHLLTMTAGRGLENRAALHHTDDWPHAFLGEPLLDAPGQRFFYNSTATYMLSALLHRTTGMPLMDYLEPRLLEPLAIRGATWDTDPRGIAVGGWGLSLRTEDIAKFGQLYLQDGWWEGHPLLPLGWVAEATRAHISTRENLTPDWRQGYGYQFWRSQHGFRADGAFGQFCLVLPQFRMVIATTARLDDLQGLLTLFWSILLPALDQPAASDPSLTDRLAKLRLKPLSTLDHRNFNESFQCENGEVIRLTVDSTRASFIFGNQPRIEAGIGNWVDGAIGAEGEAAAVASCGAWIRPGEFRLRVQYRRSPANTEVSFQLEGDRLEMRTRRNGNLYVSPNGPWSIGERMTATTD